MKVTRSELYLFLFLTIFSIFWISFVTPLLTKSDQFARLNPVVQYLTYNIGLMMLTIVMINLPYKFVMNRPIDLKDMIKVGIMGWLLFSLIFDMFQPPYYLSTTGQILITSQQALPNTAIDAVFTYLWSFLIPPNIFIHGLSLLYISVYLFSPVITVAVMIILFKPTLVKKIILQR